MDDQERLLLYLEGISDLESGIYFRKRGCIGVEEKPALVYMVERFVTVEIYRRKISSVVTFRSLSRNSESVYSDLIARSFTTQTDPPSR